MTTASLLVELLTEELPPKALKRLGEAFADSILKGLTQDGLIEPATQIRRFASPRRLAVHFTAIRPQAPDRPKKEKLLPTAIALDASGKPTAPLIKKLAALGVTLGQDCELSDLQRENDGKQEQLFYEYTARGASLAQSLQSALTQAIEGLPIPKVMSYQLKAGQTVHFVRPAHGLVALYGNEILPVSSLGLTAGRTTQGHRFHCKVPITLDHADHYEEKLLTEGQVVASFEVRRSQIEKALNTKAAPDRVVMPDALLDEVTSLVEWPQVLEGRFEAAFLSVPQECLILTMQQNQKYFALTDAQGRLTNRFLLVANIQSKDPAVLISGNERVLRARLSDAKFFFDQDRKRSLASRIDGLTAVVYHNKIGNQRQRIDRLARLARQWAAAVGAQPDQAERAALLAKTDLLTDMVGEFPELQGIIGTYYARHDQEAEEVALAIEGHYRPRFAGDELPRNAAGVALALADKMETMVGIWGIGLAPTGDKDPFALRRHALGVVRILIEKDLSLDLKQMLSQTQAAFEGIEAVKPDLSALQSFILDRLRAQLREQGHRAEAIEAVLAQCPDRLGQVPKRLSALADFMMRPESESLCAANKRISNILKKSEAVTASVQPQLLKETAERALAQMLAEIGPKAEAAVAQGHYSEALAGLSVLKAPVDEFFDQVMVNAEDAQLRSNRLALLATLHRSMNQVADLARLAG
ncbi:MAG: glycine--tRNA ligase subunit beta [Betaproteobacteria bacterium]|jgi:glycyl-tRNA synthetase beta chain|nr:glycine--tRNA ligase subunit beta [Betaproteobacteria bacterium]